MRPTLAALAVLLAGWANRWWHSGDTYDTMLLVAGDEATPEAGFQDVLDPATPLALRAASAGFVSDN